MIEIKNLSGIRYDGVYTARSMGPPDIGGVTWRQFGYVGSRVHVE